LQCKYAVKHKKLSGGNQDLTLTAGCVPAAERTRKKSSGAVQYRLQPLPASFQDSVFADHVVSSADFQLYRGYMVLPDEIVYRPLPPPEPEEAEPVHAATPDVRYIAQHQVELIFASITEHVNDDDPTMHGSLAQIQ
jgi:hypothetical protein